jgi:signal transduction histidine kinase
MVDKIASRLAGLRLSSIIAVLLLPLLFLTTQIYRKQQSELSKVHMETMGLEYARALFPVFADAIIQKFDSEEGVRVLQTIQPQAEALGFGKEHKQIQDAIKASGQLSAAHLKALHMLIEDAGIKSGALSDPDPESVLLARHISQLAPQLVSDFAETRAIIQEQAKQSFFNPTDFAKVILAMGQWRAAIAAIHENFGDIARFTEDPGFAQIVNMEGDELIRLYDDAYSVVGYASNSSVQAVLPSIGVFRTGEEFVNSIQTSWEFSVSRFENLLRSRHVREAYSLKRAVILAAISTLLSLGSAILMFRSTLRRLDVVEASSREATAARNQAEAANERLVAYNSDIAKLNSDLADKMRRLKDAQDELLKRGRLEQLGQLTATVAHELRNPLGAVRTSAYVLERHVKAKGLNADTQFKRINTGISRCDKIITQLLDFSRTRQIEAADAVLDDWLEATLPDIARDLPEKISLRCDLTLGDLHVAFDPSRLQRALINMINNASEAMTNLDRPPIIEVSTQRHGEMVRIIVKDNGPGMTEEVLHKVREPLFTTKNFGTGLGVPAIEQIALQHGGSLEIESTPGVGSTFSIILPIGKSEQGIAA